MISRREFIHYTAFATAIVALPVSVSVADDSPPDVRSHSIDRRNASSDVTYTLMVLARAKSDAIEFPGHAFFLVGEDDAKEKVCHFDKTKGFGFYPDESAGTVRTILSAVAPVPGSVRTDLKRDFDQKLITRRLDIIIAQNGYDAAKAVADKYPADKDYQLAETDCVTFVHDVLNAIMKATDGATANLAVPDKTYGQKPASYLSALLKANGF